MAILLKPHAALPRLAGPLKNGEAIFLGKPEPYNGVWSSPAVLYETL